MNTLITLEPDRQKAQRNAEHQSVVRFTTIRALFRTLWNADGGGSVLVKDISVDRFKKWDAQREEILFRRIFLCMAESKTLIVPILTRAHESLYLEFIRTSLYSHSDRHGIRGRAFGAIEFQNVVADKLISAREPDTGYGPSP
ncbi:hypothetical protein PT974_04904 [Cladobotryum mycophilum]|uniref:Uncharacterized protein n=1 Tax=Cladobotryum mycophilum TaxID=491253 RepID=A0ABR0SRS9_9HYPO